MQDNANAVAPSPADDDPDWRSDEEASRLRDEVMMRLLKMPPKPEERLGRKPRRAKKWAAQAEQPAVSRTSG
jgi:hypothetical protein